MFRIFNMGVGMTAVVGPEDTDAAVRVLRENGVEAYPIGTVVPGTEGVVLCLARGLPCWSRAGGPTSRRSWTPR